MIYDKPKPHPVRDSLALAEEHLQFILSHPSSRLDLERIEFALALIKFARTQREEAADAKPRSEPH